MPESENARLFARLKELVATHGHHWGAIAEIIEKEGFLDKGKRLSSNALRKRYKKLSGTGQPSVESEPVSRPEHAELDFDRFQKGRMESSLKQFEGGGAAPPDPSEDPIAGSISGIVRLNNQLLEEIQQSRRMIERLERLVEGQTSHTPDSDTEQPVTPRELLELLKEATTGRLQMQFTDQERRKYVAREEVQQLIEEIVQDRVDAELKIMLSQEGSFSRDLARLVDKRLKTLFGTGNLPVETTKAGPGRGKKGKSHVKFSASLESSLYARAKSLPGQFSRHLANALSSYLAVMEQQKRD